MATKKARFNKFMLVAIILVHYVVFVSFLLCVLLGFRVLPWYVAVTLSALIIRGPVFDTLDCPLTVAENKYRVKLDIYPSKGFIKDFIIFPKRTIKMLINKLR